MVWRWDVQSRPIPEKMRVHEKETMESGEERGMRGRNSEVLVLSFKKHHSRVCHLFPARTARSELLALTFVWDTLDP